MLHRLVYAVFCFNIPLKTLVNNESLFNWYLKQFKTQVEDAFIEDNRDYITIANNNTKVFWDLFKTYPAVKANNMISILKCDLENKRYRDIKATPPINS